MKREEVVEFIEADLLEFLDNYHNSSDARRKYVLQNTANNILDLIEGLGYEFKDENYWNDNPDKKSGAV